MCFAAMQVLGRSPAEAGVSAGHGQMVQRLRGLGRRHAAAAQASSSRRPPPSIRSAPGAHGRGAAARVARRIRLKPRGRGGAGRRREPSRRRRRTTDEGRRARPACPTPARRLKWLRSTSEGARGRRAHAADEGVRNRGRDAARAQSAQRAWPTPRPARPWLPNSERLVNLQEDCYKLHAHAERLEVEELASLERDLHAAVLRRSTRATRPRLRILLDARPDIAGRSSAPRARARPSTFFVNGTTRKPCSKAAMTKGASRRPPIAARTSPRARARRAHCARAAQLPPPGGASRTRGARSDPELESLSYAPAARAAARGERAGGRPRAPRRCGWRARAHDRRALLPCTRRQGCMAFTPRRLASSPHNHVRRRAARTGY